MLINPAAMPMAVLASLLFWLGYSLERKANSPAKRRALILLSLILALPCLACDLFYTHLFDSWAWFYSFRAMPFSELSIAGLGLLAGVLYASLEPETLGERLVVPIVLVLLLGLPFAKPILAPVDLATLQSTCDSDVCLQSTFSTCGPSSAATLLKLYGHAASEREIAEEALTYRGGTDNWHLARALRRRGLDAEFVILPPDSSWIPSPSIAGVVLEGGAGHFITILSATEEEVVIGDPLKGKLTIRRSELLYRYHFTGFFLVVQHKA